MSLLSHETMEMTATTDGDYDRLTVETSQYPEDGKFFAEIRRLMRRVVSLLVLLLVLVLVFGVASVILTSHLTSREVREPTKNKIPLHPNNDLPQTFPATSHATPAESLSAEVPSTEAPSTEVPSTEAPSTETLSTEAAYTSRSFTYLTSTENLGGYCFSAFYRADGNILLGTQHGVKLVNGRNMSVTSYDTPFRLVSSIVEHHNIFYLIHEEGSVTKVEFCLPGLRICKTLLEFNDTSHHVAEMTVSSRYLVARNPDPNNDELIIYDFISKESTNKKPAPFYYPYFLNDGHLLARKDGKLSKYRVEDGEPKEVWTCDGLEEVWTMVADADGFIYGLTRNEKLVYIVSPDGKLLQTIHNVNLPAHYVGQASINGDVMFVPGWWDNKLYLFKINK